MQTIAVNNLEDQGDCSTPGRSPIGFYGVLQKLQPRHGTPAWTLLLAAF